MPLLQALCCPPQLSQLMRKRNRPYLQFPLHQRPQRHLQFHLPLLAFPGLHHLPELDPGADLHPKHQGGL